jgi:hypothetical protein
MMLGELVCWNHQPEGPPMLCILVDKDGMVELLGQVGRFGPHLFVPASEEVIARSMSQGRPLMGPGSK